MQGLRPLLYLLLVPVMCFAGAPQTQDDFRSQLLVRKLEERLALSSAREDYEPGAKETELQKIAHELTQARIERNGFIEEQGGARRLASAPPPSSLAELLPGHKGFSVFEWQVLSELYGKQRQEELLRSSFGVSSLPEAIPGKETVLWITSPSFPILGRAEAAREKAERAEAVKRLEAMGYKVEELGTSPFTRLEDLAEDLQQKLRARLAGGPALLLSHGGASAVLFHTIDLYPALAHQSEILGWVNVNGRLFGKEPRKRTPASIRAADRQEIEVRDQELRLRAERLERQVPLGVKFPVLNLVTLAGSHRPADNLREAIVPEGRTLFLRAGSGLREAGAALPTLRNP